MARYAITIFLSAFLLFQVQPIIARYLLPWYGGSPAVWTTCLLFFQVLLLCGYAYAHLLRQYFSLRKQVVFHVALLLLSAGFLPIAPDEAWKTFDSGSPSIQIVQLLLFTIGLPCLIISSSSPLLQHWLNLTRPESSPYRLYALSNFGSLLGLLIYPFIVEPILPLQLQVYAWSILYGGFLGVCCWCAISLFKIKTSASPGDKSLSPNITITLSQKILWLLLAACGSIILLAMTNQICQEIAVIPFLWILPLSLYLISFIICFEKGHWYIRSVWIPLFLVTVSGSVFLLNRIEETSIILQIIIHSATLFTSCLVCHGELVRRKPHPSRLTYFYLMVALGGAIGGLFVSLIAPLLFPGYWELHIGIAGVLILIWICTFKQMGESRNLFMRYFGRELWAITVFSLLFFLGRHIYSQQSGTLVSSRNFYGLTLVYDYDVDTENWMRYLWHNQIIHGNQYLVDSLRDRGTTYYGPESGIAVAMLYHPNRLAKSPTGLRIGSVGLGAGTIASYARKGDDLRFYEINPDVIRISNDYFYYLRKSEAEVDIVLGDARISMELEKLESGSRQYDIIALDAFSGDAIPVHLLTREAFELYLNHLRIDGILAIHVSNLHLDLSRVVLGSAEELGINAVWISNEEDEEYGVMDADWILVTRNHGFLQNSEVESYIEPWPVDRRKSIVWTDDYSNLVSLFY